MPSFFASSSFNKIVNFIIFCVWYEIPIVSIALVTMVILSLSVDEVQVHFWY